MSPLYRIVLTKTGQTTKTYTISRLRRSKHIEKQYAQTAEVVLDNSDSEFTSLDLMGYKGVISYGATTSAGDEYSATAPLWVVAQDLSFAPGFLPCYLSLIGTPNRLDLDHASTSFFPTALDQKTVKTLLKEIARGGFADWAASTTYASGDCVVPTANNALIYRCTTAGTSGGSEPTWGTTIGGTTADNTATWTCKGKEMTCYRHTTAYTITFDSDDTLIDAFIPADAFRINLNGTRLDAMKRLIAFTKCQMRVEDDEEIHVYQPTTTGTVYNYEYKLNVADEHTFIAKGLRRRIVVPNYIQVDSHPDTGESYTGYATDSAAIEMRQYWYLRPTSNAQATSLADAILEHYKRNAEQGSATIPILNCGQEVLDYIKITGPTEVGDRVGNVEYINRTVDFTKAGQFMMTLSYGDMPDEPQKQIDSIQQVEEDKTTDVFHMGWYSQLYGNAVEGDVTISADTTLTRDMLYDDLTVNAGKTLTTDGYNVFVKGTLTLNGTISGKGKAGVAAAGGVAGAGSLGGAAGGAGGGAGCGGGGAGGNSLIVAAKILLGNGTITVAGGNGVNSSNGAGGTGSVGTDATRGGAAGGAGGVSGGSSTKPTRSLYLVEEGGAGGGGGSGSFGNTGGGGGGGGGLLFLFYHQKSNNPTLTAVGGTGGTAWDTGTAGTAGSDGVVYEGEMV